VRPRTGLLLSLGLTVWLGRGRGGRSRASEVEVSEGDPKVGPGQLVGRRFREGRSPSHGGAMNKERLPKETPASLSSPSPSPPLSPSPLPRHHRRPTLANRQTAAASTDTRSASSSGCGSNRVSFRPEWASPGSGSAARGRV
jgi:hypothetical protein